MFNSFFGPICNIVKEASVRFNFPPLKMSFKKNLTTQQAVGGGGGGVWVGGRQPKKKKQKESLLEDSWVHKSRGCKQVSRSDTGAGGHLNISQKQKRDPMLLTS
jgi:hypothetical protein